MSVTKISRRKLEEQAVADVAELIRRIPGAYYDGTTNDKTPSFDGMIQVSDNDDDSKRGGVDFVHVQVKGKKVAKLSEDSITYPIGIDDLQTYQRNGGCLFFVDQIVDLDTRKLFASLIAPAGAAELIRECETKGHKRISQKFYAIPDEGYMSGLLSFAIRRRDENGLLYSCIRPEAVFEVQIASVVDIGPVLGDRDVDVTVVEMPEGMQCIRGLDAEGYNTPLEASRLIIWRAPTQVFPVSIGVAGQVFYRELRMDSEDWEKGNRVLRFGGSFAVQCDENGVPIFDGTKCVRVEYSRNLKKRIFDCNFLKKVFQVGCLEVGNKSIPVAKSDELLQSIDEELLVSLEIEKVFELFGLESGDVDLRSFVGEPPQRVHDIYRCLFMKAPYRGERVPDDRGVIIEQLADYRFAFWVHCDHDGESFVYDVCNPASPVMAYHVRGADGGDSITVDGNNAVYIPTPMLLNPDELSEIVNLHLDSFMQLIRRCKEENAKKFGESQEWISSFCNLLNGFVLRLIEAADSVVMNRSLPWTRARRQWTSLLDCALEISEYLYSQSKELTYFVNAMQVRARLGSLTPRNQSEIGDWISRISVPWQKFALHLTLPSSNLSKNNLHELENSDRERILSYPIGHLLERSVYISPFQTYWTNPEQEIPRRIAEIAAMDSQALRKSSKFTNPIPGVYTIERERHDDMR